jgi:hypothetical protein
MAGLRPGHPRLGGHKERKSGMPGWGLAPAQITNNTNSRIRFSNDQSIETVIASEAKQSMHQQQESSIASLRSQ